MSDIDTETGLLAQAHALRDAGDYGGAERLYRDVIAQAPSQQAPNHHYLGYVLAKQGRLAEAEAEYWVALALDPKSYGTARLLGVLLLSQGRYPQGFQLMQARHMRPGHEKPQLPYPEWWGEEIAGKKLLIWPEQGLGDQIQFARFAPRLQAKGADVTLLCHPSLTRLFDTSLGVRVMAASGEVDFPDPDYWVMTMSTMERMALESYEIPAAPYLRAPPGFTPAPASKIGVMTTGGPLHPNDRHRSLSAAQGEKLRSQFGAISLDPAVTGAKDMAETAAIIQHLDMVVSVDTAVAHLAAAMGRRCCILIPAVDPDWRWGRAGEYSPWYPTMRLFRQRPGESWDLVIDRLVADVFNIR